MRTRMPLLVAGLVAAALAARAGDAMGRAALDAARFGSGSAREGIGLFPALRSFVGGVREARIRAALKAGEPWRALRFAREALAIAPDSPRLRARLANILAYDLPPLEPDANRRLAWIQEALDLLAAGLRARPGDANLLYARGFMLLERGDRYPEFDAAWREQSGGSTAASAAADFLGAVAREPDRITWVFAATVALERAGEEERRLALRGDPEAARRAFMHYERGARELAQLRAFGPHADLAFAGNAAYVDACLDEVRYLIACEERGARPDPARVAALEAERLRRDAARMIDPFASGPSDASPAPGTPGVPGAHDRGSSEDHDG